MTDLRNVTIYTDGSVFPNPGHGGWAAALTYRGKTRCISGYLEEATNNSAETEAVIQALALLSLPCVVELYTDSTYVMKGIQVAQNKWTLKTNRQSWLRAQPLIKKHRVHTHHVKGHNGNPMNELVDSLASRAREQKVGVDYLLKEEPSNKKQAQLAAVPV